MNTDLEATAYHEAGHAVMAVVERERFHYVTMIGTDAHPFPHMRSPTPWIPRRGDPWRTCALEQRAAVTLAGGVAEGLFRKGAGDRVSDTDLFTLTKLFDGMEAEEWMPITARAMACARRTIARCWPSVADVAAALLEHGTLTFDEVQEIRRAHYPDLELSP